MTNFERYKNEILKFSTQGTEEIPAIVNGKPALCDNTKCEDCELGGSCAQDFIKWLYEDDGEKHDGCDGCKYEYKGEDESPCKECAMNYTSKWERRPKKTRQDEFLEHYPDACTDETTGALVICPWFVDKNANETCGSCTGCKKKYWLQEVEE